MRAKRKYKRLVVRLAQNHKKFHLVYGNKAIYDPNAGPPVFDSWNIIFMDRRVNSYIEAMQMGEYGLKAHVNLINGRQVIGMDAYLHDSCDSLYAYNCEKKWGVRLDWAKMER